MLKDKVLLVFGTFRFMSCRHQKEQNKSAQMLSNTHMLTIIPEKDLCAVITAVCSSFIVH